ncbi:MAG: FecCD family ABC transporter permease [Anaerocolumna sp.]
MKTKNIKRTGGNSCPNRALFLPKNFLITLFVILFLLVVTVVLSIALGSRKVTPNEIIDALFHPDVLEYGVNVVRKRIPRTFFGLLCGAGLGVSGSLMQAVTRNPIADPSILGVNTGASVFVVCGIAFLNISAPIEYIILALVGSTLTSILVYGIGSLGKGGATPIKLVLAGASTSAALSCIISTVMIPRSYVMDEYRFWQVGSIGAGTWNYVSLLAPFMLIGIGMAVALAPALNAMALGDESATSLGVRTGVVRIAAAMTGVVLCGSATALAGPIGFIGLLAPHLIRLFVGADLRYTIPLSALTGAVILTISDVIGRLLSYPGELEVGVVTAFVGAPILIYTAMRSKL